MLKREVQCITSRNGVLLSKKELCFQNRHKAFKTGGKGGKWGLLNSKLPFGKQKGDEAEQVTAS